MASTCSALATSTFTNATSPPAASTASTVSAPPASLQSATTMRAPSWAKSTDATRPIPLPAPVMSATLPSSRAMSSPAVGADWCGGAGGRAGSLDRMAEPDGTAAEVSGSPAPVPASEADAAAPEVTEEQLRDQRLQRLAKLDALRDAGTDPYPVRFDADTTAGTLRAAHGDLEPGTDTGTVVHLAGRILLLRRQGKLSFATVQDRDGTIQLFVNQRDIGEEAHEAFDRLDRGDWIGVTGTVMTTKRGELSIGVREFQLLSKALRPLPEKWHGLSDVDTRYR